jgi:hypothetical protein
MSDRHEQFAGKNAALGRIWGMDKPKDKTTAGGGGHSGPSQPKLGKCEKCGQEKLLRSFRSQTHDRTEGAASYGVSYQQLCEECKPAPKVSKDAPAPTDKAIRAMLRGARKGR